MNRWITFAAVTLLALIPAWPGAAQNSLEELPGLVRAVTRVYMGPLSIEMTYIRTTYDEQGTPVCDTTVLRPPMGQPTPDPATASGVDSFQISVLEFDAPTAARDAYADIVEELDRKVANDPSLASAPPLAWEGIVDQATGVVSDVPAGFPVDASVVPIQVSTVFVQDGPYLYVIQGLMARLDPVPVIRGILAALAANEASPGEGTYDPEGGSTGGLWDKLEGVQSILGPGVVPTDFVLFPVPAETTPEDCPPGD